MTQQSATHSHRIHYQIAYVLVGVLVVAVLVSLPFALAGIIGDVTSSGTGVYELTPDQQALSTVTRIDLVVTSIDEWQRQATIQVSGHHLCPAPCDHQERFLFVAYPLPQDDGEGLPPYTAVTFDAQDDQVTQTITLPLSGEQIRYPFDAYQLRLGVIMQRMNKDNSVEGVSQANAKGHLFLSAHAHLPRQVMSAPVAIPISRLYVDNPQYQYDYAWLLQFSRPLYVQILTMLLLILTTSAAAYAVLLRPLHELVISVGALVLGVWGVRAILLGPDVNGITVVDLWLTIVVLFMMTAITVRALHHLDERSGLRLIHRFTGEPKKEGTPSPPGDSDG